MPISILANHGAVISDGTTAKQCAPVGKQGYLQRIAVTKALTGTVTIVGLRDETDTAKNLVLPIGFVGSIQLGMLFFNGFTAQKSSASDNGLVVITWTENN